MAAVILTNTGCRAGVAIVCLIPCISNFTVLVSKSINLHSPCLCLKKTTFSCFGISLLGILSFTVSLLGILSFRIIFLISLCLVLKGCCINDFTLLFTSRLLRCLRFHLGSFFSVMLLAILRILAFSYRLTCIA